jgi:hypothetical protein
VVIAGVAWWVLKTLQSAKWAGMGFVESGMHLVPLAAATLVVTTIAAGVGAWFYGKAAFGNVWKPRMRKHSHVMVAGWVLLGAGLSAQQITDRAFTPPAITARPAYRPGQGPVVAIDEAHKNTHNYGSSQFRGLVELLQHDGYRPRPFTEPVASPSLTGVDVLVVSGPGGWQGAEASLGDGEVAALITWIRRGGSLLLILDHMPAPQNGARLATALGVAAWHNGYVMVDERELPLATSILFWRGDSFPGGEPKIAATCPLGGAGYQGVDAMLAKHPITDGRNAAERVRRVATFGGSAFRVTSGWQPLLTLPQRAISLTPPLTPNAVPPITRDTPRAPVAGWLQGAVTTVERGRLAVFGETGLFSGGPAADNRQFVLNVLHWLTHVL